MAIYFSVLLILLYLIHYKNEKSIFYFAATLLFLFFATKNSNLGMDSGSYLVHFNDVINGQTPYKKEPIWLLLAHLTLLFGGGYRSFQILLFAITLPPVIYVIRQDSKNYLLSLFFYYSFFYYLNAFCISRQSLAISFLLVCFHFIKNKNLIPAIIFLCIAALCHTMSLLGVFAFIFYFKKISLKTIIILLCASFIIGFFVNEWILVFVPSKYQVLFVWPRQGFRTNQLVYSIIIASINLVFVFCLLRGSDSSKNSFWNQTVFLGLALMNGSQRLVFGLRFSQFLMITQIIFYANYIEEKNDKQLLYKICIIAYSCVYFIGLLVRDSIGVVPYQATEWIQNIF